MFTIIVPFYNGHSTIRRLVESIPENIEIIIVDDHSKEPLQSLDYNNVKILRGSRKGYFAGAVNIGISSTRGDVLILNQDVYFTGDGWLKQLLAGLEEGYSYIGERIKGVREDWPNGYIHGTYMYLTRELIDKTGLLNQRDFPMWGCTAEYQLRAARNGFGILPLEHVDDFVHTRPATQQFGESFRELVEDEPENRTLFVTTPPLVSVVIPVHGEKYAQFLPSTVNSLIGGETDLGHWEQQTFAAFEVIIVDDSSLDSTPNIIQSVIDPWKGVRSIRLDRPRKDVWADNVDKYIGKVVAMNAGIESAYGKYIIILDSDDMMEVDRLERFYRAAELNPHSIIYDDMVTFSEGKRGRRWDVGEGGYDFEKCLRKNQIHNSIMFPKSGWREVGGYPTRFKFGREDWAMNIRFGVKGYCGVKLKYAGLLYRREGQNRTLGNTRPDWMEYFRRQMVQEFKNIYEGERPMGCCGKGASASSTRNQAFAPGAQVESMGADGFTTLEYTGSRSIGASFSVWGYATLTQYRVTPGRTFLADNRDLLDNTKQNRGLLQMVEGGSLMFRVHVEPVRVVVESAPPPAEVETIVVQESAMETAVVEETIVVQESAMETAVVEEPVSELDFSVCDGTLATLEIAIVENNYSANELELLLAYERANKNRVGAIDMLEAAIGSA